MPGMNIPHLVEQDSVRAEAAAQYGGLSDAAAMIQAHKALIDPNVTQAQLHKIDPEETAKVKADIGLAQSKIDSAYGKGTYRVLDAVVRGAALSTVCEDQVGNTMHVVTGWTDAWRPVRPSVDEAAARAAAEAADARSQLSRELRLEVERQVAEARAEIEADMAAKYEKAMAKVDKQAAKTVADAEDANEDGVEEDDPSANAGSKRQGGNEEGEVVATYPRTHDELDALAAQHNFEWSDSTSKVDEKIEALREAGIEPAAEEE